MRGAAAGWLALVLLAGCGREDRPTFANLTPEVEYVGDAACATCHEDLYASYQSHGMARSFYRWTPEERVEAALTDALVHPASGLRYRVLAEGDSLVQEETILSDEGTVVHRLWRRIDFVMGSGNAARTYFTEENGRLFQLPLTWYTQADGGQGRWDFSPGYEIANGRFDRLVPDRCMACHNSYPEAVPHLEGTYTALPEGIGCERCHGPGALHAEARLTDAELPDGAVDTTIVNPAHLAFDLRLDVCQQCHLHTTVSVLRQGEDAFSYRPARPLAAHVALFADPEDQGGVAVVSHADRMQASACFTESRRTARPLECTTCHDPHEGFRGKGPAYFNETCLDCHVAESLQAAMPTPELRAQHEASANCFACHMPKVEAEDAPHASFTDHFIRVVRPGEQPAIPLREPAEGNLLSPYFARDAGTADGRTYEGMATVVYGTQQGEPRTIALGAALLDQMIQYDPKPEAAGGEAQFMLGLAHQRLGNVDRAPAPLEAAVREEATPQRLEALAEAYAAAGRPAEATERLYRQALEVQPALARTRVSYGLFLQRQSRRDEALAAYRAARAEQPSLDLGAFYEGLVLAELGRRDEAETAFAEAVHLNPAHADVLVNLFVVRASGVERFLDEPTQVFGLATRAAATPQEGGIRFGRVPSGATVKVFTAAGAPVRTLASDWWDLRTDGGRLAPSGIYLIHVRAAGGTRLFRVALASVE